METPKIEVSAELKEHIEKYLLENLNPHLWNPTLARNDHRPTDSELGKYGFSKEFKTEEFEFESRDTPGLTMKYGFIGGAAPVVVEVGYMAFKWVINNPQVVKFVVDMVKTYITNEKSKLKLKNRTLVDDVHRLS